MMLPGEPARLVLPASGTPETNAIWRERRMLPDEYAEDADASLLLSQQGGVPLGELVEERITAVGDKSGEIGVLRPPECPESW
jgi:hypothetical protein